MSDEHFWQVYGWAMCGVLWLLQAWLSWRDHRNRRRRKRGALPSPWDGAIVRNWREPHR